MRFLRWLILGLLIALCGAGILLPEGARKALVIDGIGKGIFVTYGLLIATWLWPRQNRRKPVAGEGAPMGRPVVVDGSNVMHWGGEPSEKVLQRVLEALKARGLHPIVYFDANVGYKLDGQHLGAGALAKRLGLDRTQVHIVPAKQPADALILERAVQDGLRVVSNDRYRDWKPKFPRVGEKGFLIKGMWKEGNVILLGLDRQRRGAV